MLCQARSMFPNMVRFIWQAEDWGRRKVELIEDEQLEQRDVDQVQITSMLIVDQHKAKNKQFTCIVQHDSRFDDQINVIPLGEFELIHNLYLLNVLYVILLEKNVLYFCTVCVILYKRNNANQEMFRSKAH